MGTLYSLTNTTATGTLLDYAYSLGILATEAALSHMIPLHSAIISTCDEHFPIFRWAAEHSSFKVLNLVNSDISESLCSHNTTCANSSSFSAIVFTFSLENSGRSTSPESTFEFWISWDNTDSYTFHISEVYEISYSIHDTTNYSNDTIPFNITKQTDNYILIQVSSYILDARTGYEIEVKVEKILNSQPECLDDVAMEFGSEFHFELSHNDTDFQVVTNSAYGVIIVTPEISEYDPRSAHRHKEPIVEEVKDWRVILGLSVLGVVMILAISAASIYYYKRKAKLRRENFSTQNAREFRSIDIAIEDVRIESE
jgi:hypothetical protein